MYHGAVQQGARRRTTRVGYAWVTTSLALQLGVTPARAAGDDKPDTAADARVDPKAQSSLSSAQRLADQAYELHAAGSYAAAIAMYLRAYEASNAAVTLLNIATIYDRKLHENELAREYYRRYLRSPDAEPDLVQRAAERLTALKQALEPGVQAPHKVDTEAPSPAGPIPTPIAADAPAIDRATPAHPRALVTAGIVVGATGVASIGASLVLGLFAKSKNDRANAVCDGAACSSSAGVRMAHQAGSLASASTVVFIAGLGLTSGGLAMFLVGTRAPGPSTGRLALLPSLGSRSAGLDLRGGF
jgi:hypothetical protein